MCEVYSKSIRGTLAPSVRYPRVQVNEKAMGEIPYNSIISGLILVL